MFKLMVKGELIVFNPNKNTPPLIALAPKCKSQSACFFIIAGAKHTH